MNRFFIVLFFGVCLCGIVMPAAAAPILINHTTINATKIPDQWINTIKSDPKGIDYAYTSHGLYVVGGLPGWQAYNAKYAYATAGGGSVPTGTVLKIGNRNNYDWWDDYVADTPAILDTGRFRYSMFVWCTEMSSWSTAEVDAYLAQMEAFEAAYPNIKFIYSTGHADASASDGGARCRANNARIRAYCIAHNKVLFDYEDIGSHSPGGTDYLNNGCGIQVYPASAPYADECTYNGGNWCNPWLAANPSSVFTQVADNCQSCCYHSPGGLQGAMKAGAFWWMMARLEGWDGTTSGSSTGSISVTSTPSGAKIFLDGADTTSVTPYTLTSIAVGNHNVYVTLSGYVTPTPQVISVVNGGTASAGFTLVQETGSINVTSTPPGAEIFLDGADTTRVTPYTMTGIPVGNHNVYVTLTGYVTPATQTRAVTKDATTSFDFSLTEVIPAGSINVTSTPSGAKIFLDGADTSQVTPFTLANVPVGDHTVNVTLIGYFTPAPQVIPVVNGGIASAGFTLVQENGSINVTSTPSGARIFLDSTDTSQVTPLTLANISVGNHTVNVTLSGYVTPAPQTKTVIRDAVTAFDFPLTVAPAASVTVTAPNGGETWVTGTTNRITWSSAGIAESNVNIELLKGNAVVQTILSDTENDGSYSSWSISTALVKGTDYRVRVTSVSYPAITDTSNTSFTINPSPYMNGETGVFSVGTWYLDTSGDGIFSSVDEMTGFGLPGDLTVSGNWNADGRTEIGVFRPSTHTFYLDYNGNSVWNGAAIDRAYNFGLTGDIPVSGDWNIDGKSEIGVFRPSTHTFYLDYNGNSVWNGAAIDRAYNFGIAGESAFSGTWT